MDTSTMDTSSSAPRPPNRHPSQSKARFLDTEADIPPTRDMLDDWLHAEADELDDLRIYEIVLAANELLCNAFEHGPGGCMFDMRRAGDELAVTVSNPLPSGVADGAAAISPAGAWSMPAPESRSGRGLAIVDRVAGAVELSTTKDQISITATFELLPITHTQPLVATRMAL